MTSLTDTPLRTRQLLRVLAERDEWKTKYEDLEIEMKGLHKRVSTSLDFLSGVFIFLASPLLSAPEKQ